MHRIRCRYRTSRPRVTLVFLWHRLYAVPRTRKNFPYRFPRGCLRAFFKVKMQTFGSGVVQARHGFCQTFRHSHTPVSAYITVDPERNTTSRWLGLGLLSDLTPELRQGIAECPIVGWNGEETPDQLNVLPGVAFTEVRGRCLKLGQVELEDGIEVQQLRLSVEKTVGNQMDTRAGAHFLALRMPYDVLGDWQIFSRMRFGRHDFLELYHRGKKRAGSLSRGRCGTMTETRDS